MAMVKHILENSDDFNDAKYVDAEGLLVALFAEESRPSLRWVRKMQKQRVIPFLKAGGLVRFDIAEVRASLRRNNMIEPTDDI
ncbi:hypothetical protein QEH59_04470 [Coraliomargarita sp. SDUM461004]|uniref:DNA-binding protein n=1 Tax=Thalassobacterium sedimentorum TaxID=3041258 RepID=A0ABU1AFW8_9BACT|nr:hypothetical protein [Coraliomargarita sp. SDUM461004]MDQ8193663.1 hypothetical protein [Coraliomargarita sp. SDUM461004]